MKKSLILLLLVIFIGLAGGMVYLYKTQFSGAWVAWQPPKDLLKPDSGMINDVPNTTPANFHLPAGFVMDVYAEDLKNPRTMMFAPNGNLWVVEMSVGKIVELIDSDKDGKVEKVNTLIEGLTNPHGMVEYCRNNECLTLIAETDKVASYTYQENPSKLKFKEKLADLPLGGRHMTRSLALLPAPNDNKLLISIGSTCDVCREEDERAASVQVLDLDTKVLKPYATGLRNAVFLANNPQTGKTWVTEMGRDFLNDVTPPDEINILEEGGFYGWPVCYGSNIHDTQFDKNTYFRNPCMEPFEKLPLIEIPAHSAPLGLSFVPAEGWPEDYANNLLVAYHGSWNKSEPEGYKVVRFKFDQTGKLLESSDFLTGFLDENETLYGRPADIMTLPGGKAFISDDVAGRIYRINYLGK